MTAFFERTLESLRAGRLSGPLVRWVEAHPRLAAWFVLAVDWAATEVATENRMMVYK